jgi:hypothetical protein
MGAKRGVRSALAAPRHRVQDDGQEQKIVRGRGDSVVGGGGAGRTE